MPVNFNQLYSDYTDLGVEYAKLQKQYDELKAENERLNDSCKKLFEQNCRFHNEHAALKDRAQGLVDALEKVNLFLMEQSENAEHPNARRKALKLSAEIDTALQSWNRRKKKT